MEIQANLCLCLLENIPVRNSDVDYRLLEAAKAGDLDTVKVRNALIWFQIKIGRMVDQLSKTQELKRGLEVREP